MTNQNCSYCGMDHTSLTDVICPIRPKFYVYDTDPFFAYEIAVARTYPDSFERNHKGIEFRRLMANTNFVKNTGFVMKKVTKYNHNLAPNDPRRS